MSKVFKGGNCPACDNARRAFLLSSPKPPTSLTAGLAPCQFVQALQTQLALPLFAVNEDGDGHPMEKGACAQWLYHREDHLQVPLLAVPPEGSCLGGTFNF